MWCIDIVGRKSREYYLYAMSNIYERRINFIPDILPFHGVPEDIGRYVVELPRCVDSFVVNTSIRCIQKFNLSETGSDVNSLGHHLLIFC